MNLVRPVDGQPLLPAYGRSTLAEVLPSVAAHLGLSAAGVPALDLPASSRYVLVVVDGLGVEVLQRHLAQAPWCAQLFGDAHQLTAAVPSTTATSLTTLGTGVAPGRHGVVGYSFRDPDAAPGGRVFNALAWDTPSEPEVLQSVPTWFEQLSGAGYGSVAVVPSRFEGSGLTRAALRGQICSPLDDEGDEDERLQRTVQASQTGTRSVVYVYERMLDHTGHTLGVAHPAWRQQLTRIDAWLERLRDALDDEVVLLVTGDHGMVDVGTERRLVIEHEPELGAEVDLIGGEGRFRQLYTRHPDRVAKRWRARLGERAWVHTRQEATELGWFGPVADAVAPRLGDVLVAMREDWAVMTTTRPGELGLVGMHGSLTPAEMLVPLLVDPGRHDWPAASTGGWR